MRDERRNAGASVITDLEHRIDTLLG